MIRFAAASISAFSLCASVSQIRVIDEQFDSLERFQKLSACNHRFHTGFELFNASIVYFQFGEGTPHFLVQVPQELHGCNQQQTATPTNQINGERFHSVPL